ncbi:non-specific serine/threonine protein kinase [Trifolium repens]|nr:non-specific serine/threonine protein kinase [Trifolium repens]
MLGQLNCLETLNLSHNNLSGNIPLSSGEMLRLTTVDISYSQLEGPIPTIPAFQKANIEEMRNNKDLCGNVSSLKPCPTPSATEAFDNKHLIGVGGHGSVYKAELPTGQVVAVKKLHSLQNGEMSNLKAFANFGTSKFLNPNSSNWTSFAGTFGYAAPELAHTMEVNEKCDVYSFGILTLRYFLGSILEMLC